MTKAWMILDEADLKPFTVASIKARWHGLSKQAVPRATELVCRKGHNLVKLLWKDLLQLREELEVRVVGPTSRGVRHANGNALRTWL